MEKKVLDLFLDLSDEKVLLKIRNEVKSTSIERIVKRKATEVKETRRGKSEYVLDQIHETLGKHHLDCRNAEGPCIRALIEQFMTAKIGKQVIDSLALLYPALYVNQNVLAGEFSKVSTLIQRKFPSLAVYAKEKLRISKEARILQQTNYSAKVTRENANLREITDTKVLDVITQLRQAPQDDFISKIVMVALCVGSRISEICMVSTYKEVENPHYIEIVGVSKEKRGPNQIAEPEGEDEKKEQVPQNPRTFTKPIILLLNEEIIDTVVSIREILEKKYGYDLGEGYGWIQLTESRKLVNNVDAKANVMVRELFGNEFVMHDCRAIYAQMAWVSYAPPGVSQTYYYSQILGHKENSLTTALSYQKFAIRRKLKEDDPDLVAKITNLEVEMKGLKNEIKQEITQEIKRMDAKEGHPAKDAHEITFFSRAKNLNLTLKKEPRIQEGPEKRIAKLRTLVQQMIEGGIRPTHRNVASLGFGSKIVNQYFKEEKMRAKNEGKPSHSQEQKEQKEQ